MADAEPDISLRIFREVHSGLPREGPGDKQSTARALSAAAPLAEQPRILDIACGPGKQTLDLAALCKGARITAVDAYEPFVQVAARRVAEAGAAGRVTVERADMRNLPFAPGSFDLLWCEGAAYIMGVAAALSAWRALLAPGGRIAFSEAVWLSEDPPAELRDWWQSEYPDIGSVDACLALVQGSGYSVTDSFVLPEAAWWDDYYNPMAARLQHLRAKYAGDAAALAALEEQQREIDYYRRWSAHYGYLFVIAALATEP